MNKFLKFSLITILIGISMLIFFCIYTGDFSFKSINDIIISQYRSGIYTEKDISNMNDDKILNVADGKLLIYAKYIDVQVSKDVDKIHIEYYSLPNVNINFSESSDGGTSAVFLSTKFEIVFNKNIEDYKKVKVIVPENTNFNSLFLIGQDIKVDGINSEKISLLSEYTSSKNILNVSNINVQKCYIQFSESKIDIKNSKISDLEMSTNNSDFTFENLSGTNLNFGRKMSTNIYNVKVNLNNVDYTNQGYYGNDINIYINNNLELSKYYFIFTKRDNEGSIKINNKEYTSDYESDNKNDCKYKISVRSNKANFEIK